MTELDYIETPSAEIKRELYPFAGFWMRFWAYLVDLIVIASLSRLLIKPIFVYFGYSMDDSSILSPFSLADGFVFYTYFILMTKLLGQTLGKMLFGLKVIDLHKERLAWSTIFFREFIGRYISSFFFLGYLIIGILPKKQGFHDLFADTTVVLERR